MEITQTNLEQPGTSPKTLVSDSTNEKVFFQNLDALRFIAFSTVFLQHGFYYIFKPWEQRNYLTSRIVNLVFNGGSTGVQIFFVLSGFLITYLLLAEVDKKGKIDVPKFYVRRALRIWPLYYATMLFAFVLYPWLKHLIGIDSNLCSRPFYYFTFLANFDVIHVRHTCPGQDAMSQGIAWSVAVEEQFYVVWPLLFVALPKKMHGFIFPLVVLGAILFRANATGAALYFHTFAVMGDLAIGGMLAYLCVRSETFKKSIRNLRKSSIAVIYAIIFLLYFFSDELVYPGSETANRLIFDLCFGFIILEQCFAKNALFPLGRLKHFSSLGKISYGLYMLHPIGILIIDILFRVLHQNSSAMPLLIIKGIIAFIVSVFLSKASFKWLEKPFLKIKNNVEVIKTR